MTKSGNAMTIFFKVYIKQLKEKKKTSHLVKCPKEYLTESSQESLWAQRILNVSQKWLNQIILICTSQ